MLDMQQQTKYLTVKQIAEMLGESESTVVTWIAQKRLIAYKFGKKWKVTEDDLEEFIKNSRNK